MSNMIRQIMALFDEYQSRENAKHTLRAMNENAWQGFWNGALPPISYSIVAAEQRGAKIKKKLEIDPLHADTVRLVYRLALYGHGDSGPMALKSIVTHLNDRDIRTHDGGRWGIGTLHQVLTRTTYIGEHRFNTHDHKTKRPKPEAEHAVMAVPSIIAKDEWDAVQAHLKSRNPQWIAPRIVSGPTLLTGIAFCASCGGAMTLRTGKYGRYRYYTCSTRARQGSHGCGGVTVPMGKLDAAVADHIERRLLDRRRLTTLLSAVLDRREEYVARRRRHPTRRP